MLEVLYTVCGVVIYLAGAMGERGKELTIITSQLLLELVE